MTGNLPARTDCVALVRVLFATISAYPATCWVSLWNRSLNRSTSKACIMIRSWSVVVADGFVAFVNKSNSDDVAHEGPPAIRTSVRSPTKATFIRWSVWPSGNDKCPMPEVPGAARHRQNYYRCRYIVLPAMASSRPLV